MSLIGIIEEWTEQSGELPQDILSNLSSQDEHDQLPPKTVRLVGGDGNNTDKLDRFLAAIRAGDYGFSRQDHEKAMRRLVATKSGILEFCKLKKIKPPRSVAGSFRYMFWREHEDLAPQRYPLTKDEHAEVERKAEIARKEDETRYLESRLEWIEGQLTELTTHVKATQERSQAFNDLEWDLKIASWIDLISRRIGEFSHPTVSERLSQRLGLLEQECMALRTTDTERKILSEKGELFTIMRAAVGKQRVQSNTDNSRKQKILNRVPWTVQIPKGDRRENFAAELVAEESAGVLNWLIDGYIEFLAIGLASPVAVTDATSRYRNESDIIGDFLAAWTLQSPDAEVLNSDLLRAYEIWCGLNGRKPVSQTKFGKLLNAKQIEYRVSGVTYRVGISLTSEGFDHVDQAGARHRDEGEAVDADDM